MNAKQHNWVMCLTQTSEVVVMYVMKFMSISCPKVGFFLISACMQSMVGLEMVEGGRLGLTMFTNVLSSVLLTYAPDQVSQ